MFAVFLLALAAPSAAQSPADPLAPSARGEAQCYQPDEQRKTCRSLAYYRSLGGSEYSNKAVVLLSASGPVTLETDTPVTVRNGAVCGAIRAEDIARGAVRAGGRLLDAKEAAPILARVRDAMGAILEKEICTLYAVTATGMVARVTMGGVPAGADQPVKWVRPDAGYAVAP